MWKYSRRAAACLAGACLLSVPSLAASIGYVVSGSFPAAMALTSVSDPAAGFVLSFEVPVPAAPLPGTSPGGFDVALPSDQLVFNGQTVGLNVTLLELFDDADGGGPVLWKGFTAPTISSSPSSAHSCSPAICSFRS